MSHPKNRSQLFFCNVFTYFSLTKIKVEVIIEFVYWTSQGVRGVDVFLSVLRTRCTPTLLGGGRGVVGSRGRSGGWGNFLLCE